MSFNFFVSSPENVGVSSSSVGKLLDMFIGEDISANAMLMIRHGKIFAEFYRTPYSMEKYHVLASITKSVVSVTAGIAVREGLITVNDYIVDYFKDITVNPNNHNMNLMQIEHLLTMTSGFDGEFHDNEYNDAVMKFISTPVPNKPGEKFVYNTNGVIVLSRIIEKASGLGFDEYVYERMFKPLDIEHYIWEKDENGLINSGFGLHLKARDIAKIGLMMLNKGIWGNIRLLDETWVERSTSSLSKGGQYGYGYLFWKQQPDKSYSMTGLGGQYCLILPEQDIVIVLFDAQSNKIDILNSIWKTVLNDLDSGNMKKCDLSNKYSKIIIEIPSGDRHINIEKHINSKKYTLEVNSLNLTHISFNFNDYELIMYENEKFCVCKIGYGKWFESETYVNSNTACTLHYCALHTPVSIAGAWENNIFHMKMVYNTTPMVDDMYVKFSNDFNYISIDYKRSEKSFFNPDTTIKGSINEGKI